MGEDGHTVPKIGDRSTCGVMDGPAEGPPRVPPLGSVTSLALPSVDLCPVFLLSSPDLPQLPTPHVHSTPAPPPGPSQPISHASMAFAPSFTPALIQGTVSSFSVSLRTHCSPAQPEKLHRRTVAQPWPGNTPARCPARLQSLWCVWILAFSRLSLGLFPAGCGSSSLSCPLSCVSVSRVVPLSCCLPCVSPTSSFPDVALSPP